LKARKVLSFIIIILLLIIGALALVYYKTDIFKTNAQKFFKYANQNIEMLELFNNECIQSIKNRRSNNPYEVNSSLSIRKGTDNYLITANTSAQNSNDITTDIDFQYNDKDIINFMLVKKSNLIGAKIDELANGYIAIKNNDIHTLAKDAGIEDVSNIPENINWVSLLDILYIQESDERYLIDTYSQFLLDNTKKENYSREESGLKIDDKIHMVTGYKLELSEKETKELIKKLLTSVRDDDARTVNLISSKMKLLNIPQKYSEPAAIREYITKLIDKVDKFQATDAKYLEITVYMENAQTIQTNIKVKNGNVFKFIIKRDENKLCIVQENPNKDLEQSENVFLKYLGNMQEITLSNEMGEDKNSVIIKFNAKFYNNLSVEYNSRIAIVESVEKNTDFDDSTKLVLNEIEPNNLKKLCNMIKERIPKIIADKKAMMTGNFEYEEEQTQSENNALEN